MKLETQSVELKTSQAGHEHTSWTHPDEDSASPILMDERRTIYETKARAKKRNFWILVGMGAIVVASIASVLTVFLTKKSTTIAVFASGNDVSGIVLDKVAHLTAPVFKYKCTNNQCVAQNLTKEERFAEVPTAGPGILSLRVCEMTCGNGSMLPMPRTLMINNPGTIAVNVEAFTHQVTGGDPALLKEMQAVFNQAIARKKQLVIGNLVDVGQGVKVVGNIANTSPALTRETDESYELSIDATTVTISANNVFGYRHGLASLLQLVDWCDLTRSLRMVATISMKDKPFYRHRGILIDTARNFLPISALERLIRTMGDHKLNILHWHITDSSSFPIEIKGEPRFNKYGAYQSNLVYTQKQVKELVAYAKIRGVKIIPEIDAPAHAGAGWQWGPDAGLGELTLCWADTPWMPHCLEAPCGQLNPMNEKVYELMDLIWTELGGIFESDIFHLGGDEVFFPCWYDSPVLSDKVVNKTEMPEYIEIWAKFQQRVQNALWARDASKKIVLWSSDLTTTDYFKYLPKDKVTVQTWNMLSHNEPRLLTDAGYEYIASFQEAHYLDCGLNGVAKKDNGWCYPYKTWQVVYDQWLDPNVTANNTKLIVGGELVYWSEVTGGSVMDDKIWPRAAAFAERTWTNPNLTWIDVMNRMTIASYRIVESGSGSDMVQPLWCRTNPGMCTLLPW